MSPISTFVLNTLTLKKKGVILVLLPFPSDLTLNNSCTRKSHNKTYKLLPALVDPYKYSCFTRCIPVWNSFPLKAAKAQSLAI